MFTIFRGARLHKVRAAKYRQILSLLYLGFVSFLVILNG